MQGRGRAGRCLPWWCSSPLVVLAAACGSSSSSGSSTSPSASASAAVGVLPSPTPGSSITVDYHYPAPPKSVLAQFTKQTGVKVNWVEIGWDDLQTKIAAAAHARTPTSPT